MSPLVQQSVQATVSVCAPQSQTKKAKQLYMWQHAAAANQLTPSGQAEQNHHTLVLVRYYAVYKVYCSDAQVHGNNRNQAVQLRHQQSR